jgi:ribonucleoside-diphosphate reductase alpha chain
MNVQKRGGTLEPINLDKLHQVIYWACNDIENVSVSQIELKSHIQMYDGIKTGDIHDLVIKSAAELISEEYPNYQYPAARLSIFNMRKKVYGRYTPQEFDGYVKQMVEANRYDSDLLHMFTTEERMELGRHIDHNKDLNFTYAAVMQWQGKYLGQNRVTEQLYETPQMAYMAMAMTFFQVEPEATRMDIIKEAYTLFSDGVLSLPTPIMSGLRTPTRQFSSCVLIEADDSLDAINATSSSIVKYISQRAGVGINVGRIRALGSAIRNGEAKHTGLIPFIKHFQTAVKSCSQGGVRGGAATLFYPLWHLEVEALLVLKNNRGTEENRVRHLDYGVQFNKLMYQRILEGGNITLFSPSDVPGLYDAFFADQPEFERLYTMYEQDESINKKTIKAIELFTTFAQERAQTGRIYLQNVDHCNTHSPFDPSKAPVRQSNLCLEIALPTTPLTYDRDPDGEIALCTLAAFNLGVDDLEEKLPRAAYIIVKALDNLLDYQDYPMAAAEKAKKRRTLGVGVTNLAYRIAKEGKYYSNGSANNLVHELFERIQFNLLEASNTLAMERGPCDYYGDTNYAKGLLPIDTYKKDVDTCHNQPLVMDWETLRHNIDLHGLRNSTVTALMPCETSSQITNSTNGIEPPRGYVSVKKSKDGVFKQVVPDIGKVNYELLWQMPSNKGYLEIVGIAQKFVDQAISANTNYDPKRFSEEKVPIDQILEDLVLAYKLGLKTLYYHNTRDGAGEEVEDDSCASGACKL